VYPAFPDEVIRLDYSQFIVKEVQLDLSGFDLSKLQLNDVIINLSGLDLSKINL